jgi:membrane protein
MLRDLVDSAIISETCEDDGREVAYQPAQDVDLFTIKYVIDALEQRGIENIPVASSEALEKISECLTTFDETLKRSPANTLLKDI